MGWRGLISRSYCHLKDNCRAGWEGVVSMQLTVADTEIYQPMRHQALGFCLHISAIWAIIIAMQL